MTDPVFLGLVVVLPIIIAESVLLACWKLFGEGKAYVWYACILRTLAYSPCVVGAAHGHGIMPMPVASALLLNLRGGGGEILWLYGLPEIAVGVIAYFVSFVIRERMLRSR